MCKALALALFVACEALTASTPPRIPPASDPALARSFVTVSSIRALPSWQLVTVDHAFVRALRDGTMRGAAFRRWYEQDMSFGETIGRLLAKAIDVTEGDARSILIRLEAFDGSVYGTHAPAHDAAADAIGATAAYRAFVCEAIEAADELDLLVLVWMIFEIYALVWAQTSYVPAAPFCAAFRPLYADAAALGACVDDSLAGISLERARRLSAFVDRVMAYEVAFLDLLQDA